MENHLEFRMIEERDLDELADVMRRAFDHDAQVHLGITGAGPEGYANGDFFRRWLFPYEESHGWKIMQDDRIVGGMIVWILKDRNNRLGTIFIDPEIQNRGVGTAAWNFIERTYDDALSWELGTPGWAVKNHYFYEKKCGFQKIREEEAADHDGGSWIFRKNYPLQG